MVVEDHVALFAPAEDRHDAGEPDGSGGRSARLEPQRGVGQIVKHGDQRLAADRLVVHARHVRILRMEEDREAADPDAFSSAERLLVDGLSIDPDLLRRLVPHERPAALRLLRDRGMEPAHRRIIELDRALRRAADVDDLPLDAHDAIRTGRIRTLDDERRHRWVLGGPSFRLQFADL